MSFLRRILPEVEREVERRKRERPFQDLSPPRPKRSLIEAIRGARGVALIAELKLSSPSAGRLRSPEERRGLAEAMVRGGAVALSVLTEPRYFGGDPRFLRELSDLPVPLLCKDFVVDPYQIEEASRLGADAILLLAAVLGERLPSFLRRAEEEGMEALVEVTDEEEMGLALSAGARLVGINNRDLNTLEVDPSRTERLAPLVPPGVTLVSESGIETPEQVRRMLRAGAHAVLVGTALMRAERVEEKVRELVGAWP
ncbi:MAG: indole-3-glycerol-phosphate synthase [Hadesarchaea archaeon]|jgi:indole-3-glycerol phosphate synthase|nr:indole-3-glycerol-phosphate synthase [Hadesarchaea archaeon]